jgi:gas vesicle protein
MATNKGGGFITGLLIGGTVGAISALLYSPRSGAENREMIRNETERLRDRTTEMAHDVTEQAQMKLGQVRSQLRNKTEEISHQTHQVLDRGREMVERQKDAVRTAVQAGREAYVEKQTELQSDVAEDLQPASTTHSTIPTF